VQTIAGDSQDRDDLLDGGRRPLASDDSIRAPDGSFVGE
jgi:hypothetical protein